MQTTHNFMHIKFSNLPIGLFTELFKNLVSKYFRLYGSAQSYVTFEWNCAHEAIEMTLKKSLENSSENHLITLFGVS